MTRRLYTGVLASVAEVVLLAGAGEETALSPNPWLGNALEFLAMLCAVGYTLVVRRLSVRYPALVVLAYLFYNHALGLLPASQAAVYVSLIPALGAFLGWLLLDETLSLAQGAAILLTVAWVVCSQTGVADLDPAHQPVES